MPSRTAPLLPHAAIVLLLAAAGCAEPLPPPAATPARQAALAALDRIEPGRLQAAFEGADAAPRRARTLQRAADGRVLAVQEVVWQRAPDGHLAATVRTDSGAFRFGGLEALPGGTSDAPPRLGALAEGIVSGEAAYLAPRNHDQYDYALLPDTLLGGQRVQVIQATARPGVRQALRAVRLYVAPAPRRLVGLRYSRAEASLIYRETSTQALFLTPSDSAWLPAYVHTRAQVWIPFVGTRRLETHLTVEGR